MSHSEIAYFSMEVGLTDRFSTFSGGLGILSGDTLRAAADLELPVSGITLVHRKGYFRQSLTPEGIQEEETDEWDPAEHLEEVPERVSLSLPRGEIRIRAWRHDVVGRTGHRVPVYLLDTDLPENAPEDRAITDRLYGGHGRRRLLQEAVLGLGGWALLRALGHEDLHTCHLNEGHSSLLTLALLQEALEKGESPDGAAVRRVRGRCVFTTHTPVPAGHDRFPMELVTEVLGERRAHLVPGEAVEEGGVLNLTLLALHFARFSNGVAMRHAGLSREMFPGHRIHSITNGVHVPTWTGEEMAALFDRCFPEWRVDPAALRHAVSLDPDELWEAHGRAKSRLFDEVERRTGTRLDPGALTLGFARRATRYKRADLFLSDPDRLRKMARERGALQVIYAGKAHPEDEDGKAVIRRVFQGARALEGEVPVVYVEDFGIEFASLLYPGVDVWLNTPRKPKEASGTSGMKAALNGVPSLSVVDGWWVEGHVEGVTGWAVGGSWREESRDEDEARSLYEKLESEILPLFHDRPRQWARIMRASIALNGSHFTAMRMMRQYRDLAYRPSTDGEDRG